MVPLGDFPRGAPREVRQMGHWGFMARHCVMHSVWKEWPQGARVTLVEGWRVSRQMMHSCSSCEVEEEEEEEEDCW